MMEKMKMETANGATKNIELIESLFPGTITEVINEESKMIEKKIDMEALKQQLSCSIVDENSERYNFTWPGKNEAIIEANRPIRKTLRPCIKDSENWENTNNVYIIGDNLEALKIIQESYLNSVKLIYIDPPYNTGNDFLYNDAFSKKQEKYLKDSGQKDSEDNNLFRNLDTRGHFHSDWCSMIYSRLLVARNLLKKDGVILISIDDNEIQNLRKICDEVFSEKNFLSQLIWVSGRTSSSHFTNSHEYILAYAKDINSLPLFKYTGDATSITDRTIKKQGVKNPASCIDFPAGIEFEGPDRIFPNEFGSSELIEIVNGTFECKDGKLNNPVTIRAGWAMKDMILSWLRGHEVVDQKGQRVTRFYFKSNGVLQYEKEKGTIHPNSIIQGITTKMGSNEVKELLGGDYFPYPKPTELIEYFSPLMGNNNDGEIIMDFFGGSSTTADAIMNINSKDGGNRRFILIQYPEPCATDSSAFESGFNNICEIGIERIRQAGNKLNTIDTGFRVFKIDEPNVKDVYYAPQNYQQKTIDNMIDNIKEDRNDLDLLFGIMTEWGLELSLSVKTITIDSRTIYTVDNNALVACFEKQIPEHIMRDIAKIRPTFAVFRDSSFADSQNKINLEEIFKSESPETKLKIL